MEYNYFRESPSQDWNHQFPKNRVSQNKLWKATKNTQNIFDHCPKIKKHMWTSQKKTRGTPTMPLNSPQKNGQTLGKSQKATIRQGPWAVSPPKPRSWVWPRSPALTTAVLWWKPWGMRPSQVHLHLWSRGSSWGMLNCWDGDIGYNFTRNGDWIWWPRGFHAI